MKCVALTASTASTDGWIGNRLAGVGGAAGVVDVVTGERNGRRVQSILPRSMPAGNATAAGQSSDQRHSSHPRSCPRLMPVSPSLNHILI